MQYFCLADNIQCYMVCIHILQCFTHIETGGKYST